MDQFLSNLPTTTLYVVLKSVYAKTMALAEADIDFVLQLDAPDVDELPNAATDFMHLHLVPLVTELKNRYEYDELPSDLSDDREQLLDTLATLRDVSHTAVDIRATREAVEVVDQYIDALYIYNEMMAEQIEQLERAIEAGEVIQPNPELQTFVTEHLTPLNDKIIANALMCETLEAHDDFNTAAVGFDLFIEMVDLVQAMYSTAGINDPVKSTQPETEVPKAELPDLNTFPSLVYTLNDGDLVNLEDETYKFEVIDIDTDRVFLTRAKEKDVRDEERRVYEFIHLRDGSGRAVMTRGEMFDILYKYSYAIY